MRLHVLHELCLSNNVLLCSGFCNRTRPNLFLSQDFLLNPPTNMFLSLPTHKILPSSLTQTNTFLLFLPLLYKHCSFRFTSDFLFCKNIFFILFQKYISSLHFIKILLFPSLSFKHTSLLAHKHFPLFFQTCSFPSNKHSFFIHKQFPFLPRTRLPSLLLVPLLLA